MGVLYVAPWAHEDSNTQGLMIGNTDVLSAFVRQHGLRVVSEGGHLPVGQDGDRWSGRGRRPGSTNWTRDRFWRRYRMAARGMARPYKRTHLAARIGVVYATFSNYLERWGPPPDAAAPGD